MEVDIEDKGLVEVVEIIPRGRAKKGDELGGGNIVSRIFSVVE